MSYCTVGVVGEHNIYHYNIPDSLRHSGHEVHYVHFLSPAWHVAAEARQYTRRKATQAPIPSAFAWALGPLRVGGMGILVVPPLAAILAAYSYYILMEGRGWG